MRDRKVLFEQVRAALRDAIEDDALDVRPEHHLVEDLGFDSTKMASLTIALEDQLDDVLLLHDWIASANSPSDLTVASLIEYLHGVLSEGA